jgi:hypothetical protein
MKARITLSHNVVSSTPRHELDSNSQRSWWRHWLHSKLKIQLSLLHLVVCKKIYSEVFTTPFTFTIWFVSEWEIVLHTKWAIGYLHQGKKKLHFDEMMTLSALQKTITLIWIVIMLAHWSYSRRVYMTLYFGDIIQIQRHLVFADVPSYCLLSREATNTNYILL